MGLVVGSMLEVKTHGGMAYVQAVFVHRAHPGEGLSYGWFVRVLSGLRKRRPGDSTLARLAAGPHRFGCFLSDPQCLPVVGRFPVPSEASEFPVFKQFNGVSPNPEGTWILWDGTEQRITYRLPRVAVDFPNLEIVDSLVLKQRIEQSWTPARDVPLACIDATDAPFAFSQLPRFREFLDNRSAYGDVVGFLRAKGLIAGCDSTAGVTIQGPDFWENDVAQAWLTDLPRADGWDVVFKMLSDFKSRSDRDAVASVKAYAAIGVLLCASGLIRCDRVVVPANWGTPPRSVVREAMVVAGQLGQRSGLSEPMTTCGVVDRWRAKLSEYQLAVVRLLASP